MDAFLKDLKHSVRMFLRTPGFTIVVIAALALGIGTNTAIFSVVNTVLLKPLAFSDPERIVLFQNLFKGGRGGSASPNEYNFWRQQTRAFQDVSAYAFNVANLTGEAAPEQIQTTRASANFFRLCGADIIRGRTYTAEEDLPKAPKTAVLAYGFWQRRFGSDPQVIGKRITLSSESYEIIGVVGPNLKIEIDRPPDVYVPFQLDPARDDNGHYFTVIGRLKPGVTLAAASAQLQAGYQEYKAAHPVPFDFPQIGFGVQPLQDALVGGVRNSLLILVGAVSFVLLIACANVANLLLARATGRKREIAIRAAVGAGRGRIVRQLLTESVMLSLAGGVLGLAAGYAGIRGILRVSPGNIPRIGLDGASVGLDWRVLAFTLGLSVVTGILFGLVPALQSSRADLNGTLKESSSRSGTGLRHNKTRAVLVTTEMALALVLLVGAALLIRTFVAIRQVHPGFDPHNVVTMRMSLTGPQFAHSAGVTQLVHDGLRRIRALPGVEVAASTCCVPLEGGFGLPFQIPGRPEGPTSKGGAGWTMVSAGYFETFQIPVLRGRTYTEQDDSGPPVVIINQALAKQFWPKGDPLSDRMIIGHGVGPAFQQEPPRQIIGVVGDVRDGGLNRDPQPIMYVLSAQITDGENALVSQIVPWAWVIRTRVPPLSLSTAIQKELREASGGLPVANVRTMEETIARSTASQNFNMLVLTIFGCAALLLAAIGIYGLMAYSVAQRTQEIGIRLALGAGSGSVRNMVVFQGLRLAGAGVAIGLAAAFGLTRLIASLLFGVKAWDPLVFVAVPVILIGVALVAVWLPALRASRVDPIHALRYE
ncbi:MAG: ABC transporter permease [Acidobacteriia bacterium]|nr:ABC transporter permease [Terriglobia bacterium]